MAFSPLLMSAVLGVVEGVTEFLPVSSTAHLLLADKVLGFEGPPGKLFEIVIQLGAILSVCWLFRAKLIDTVRMLFVSPRARHFAVNIILAFIPAGVIGALAYRVITEVLLNNLWVVAGALILGGIAILIIERLPSVTHPRVSFDQIEDVPPLRAFGIGLFQSLSVIPGTSRSAATIMGALLMGVTRKTAAEFSFILAIPTMFAATLYSLYKNRATLSTDGAELIAVGFVVSFIVALIVVRWMIGFISKHGFAPFAYYRIVVGVLMIVIMLTH